MKNEGILSILFFLVIFLIAEAKRHPQFVIRQSTFDIPAVRHLQRG